METATGKTTGSSIVTDQSRAPFAPTSASTFSTSITPALSTTEWTCKVDPCAVTSPWILIMTRDYTVSYKEAFKDATRRDYRDGFGSALTRYSLRFENKLDSKQCIYVFILIAYFGPMDGPTDERTDGHTLLWTRTHLIMIHFFLL